MPQRYEYEAIKRPYDIRLLTLLPGEFSNPIHVVLHSAELSESSVPHYEALSYVWGDPTNPVDIFFGEAGDTFLPVTRNLAIALPYLRNETVPRTLWIDAICVNQQDLNERSQQVRRMADIYTKASKVLAWIGEEANNSRLALAALDELGQNIEPDWVSDTMKAAAAATETHWADRKQPLSYDSDTMLAINTLMNRPWFERLWIWQEIKLAPSMSIVLCGNNTILWSHFSNAMFCIFLKPRRGNDSAPGRRRLLRSLCNTRQAVSFDEMAQRTRNTRCSDPRDRVFALLSLLPSEYKSVVKPDYTKEAGEIYQELFLGATRRAQDLSLLAKCGLYESRLPSPTWVPDWSHLRPANFFESVEPSGKSMVDYEYLGDGLLRVRGVRVGTIKQVYKCRLTNASPREDTISEIAKIAMFYKSYVGDQIFFDTYEMLCRTVVGDRFSKRYHPEREYYPEFERGLSIFQQILESRGREVLLSPEMEYTNVATFQLQGRAFFVTEEGHIGLGLHCIQPGDQVAVLLGLDSAVVLRPSSEARYKLVGDAYCQGFMFGEAILGPLPPEVELAQVVKADGGHYVYRDRGTGVVHDDDPRLIDVPLPAGWRRSVPGEYPHPQFVEAATGVAYERDPRVTADWVNGRGVDIKTITLE